MEAAALKLHFPSTDRNRDAILAVLRGWLPPRGLVLEVASGSGQHAAYFAPQFRQLLWQPSDPDPGHRASIAAWTRGCENVLPPLDLDTTRGVWPIDRADAVVCINMLHIAPWEAGLGLLGGAGRVLAPDGLLYLYGAYKLGGEHTSPSNEVFDSRLRAQDPRWGVRDLDEVVEEAERHGLEFAGRIPMPVHNFSVAFRKVEPRRKRRLPPHNPPE
ncbi:MAG: DUF938 domain-containing protein [Armatimonadetes bacterium]|nr:DUF938 domain-containing protein [Armatimonadota bacterium]